MQIGWELSGSNSSQHRRVRTGSSLCARLVLQWALFLLLICGGFLISCQKTDTADRSSAAVIDSVASEDGLMVYYQVQGSGDRALVFVHCWSCDRGYWDAQTSEFAKDYTVVTVDLGGHGQSGLGREEWTMGWFGADVAAVVEKLDLENVVLIGHSMGGAVVLEAARRLPGRVVALVGVDTYQSFGQKFTPEQIEGFLAAFRSDFPATTEQFVRSMFPPTGDSSLVNRVATDMAASPDEVSISAIADVLAYDYAEALREVRVPVRCINSDRVPTDVEGNRQVAESFDVVIMPGTGHFVHMEDPVTFNRLLRQVLNEFPGGPPAE
ncbi:MAG TPA: alpha/beta hydrolase [Acidobacteriota bacterium]|nr:alpha/beta hydrolase [Acidobacteriota bacterium]